MSYYIATQVEGPFEKAVESVIEALAAEGFGILTDIDVKATMRKKLDIDYRNYRILGACNPPFAHRALEVEDKIGIMLPCNVVVQETNSGAIEIAAVDPMSSMQAVANPALDEIANEVQQRLRRVIASLTTR
ncbi:MAG: DUF302 domain-containing protein [Spirochaetia bacterium]